MNTKHFSFTSVLFTFLMVFFISCKEKKSDVTSESRIEMHASAEYQCPMDCEDGKTYAETRSCPVCKMALKEVNSEGNVKSCAMHKGGKCTCEGDTCKCANCKEHGKTKTCAMHEGGECTCEGEACKCANCPTHS